MCLCTNCEDHHKVGEIMGQTKIYYTSEKGENYVGSSTSTGRLVVLLISIKW